MTSWRIKYFCKCIFFLDGSMQLTAAPTVAATNEKDSDDSTVRVRGDEQPFQSHDICPFHSSAILTYEFARRYSPDKFTTLQDLASRTQSGVAGLIVLKSQWYQRCKSFRSIGNFGGKDGQWGQGGWGKPIYTNEGMMAGALFPQRFADCMDTAIKNAQSLECNQGILNPLENLDQAIEVLRCYLEDNSGLFSVDDEVE